MKILGIFGWPIEHSLSPAMHNAAIKKMGLDYVYIPFNIKPSQLKTAVESIRVLNIAGVNITIPHKENVIKFLDKISDEAKKIGAVNTIVNRNGFLSGYNTDHYGFVKSIEGKTTVKNKTVFMLGCGGVAKAIAYALIKSGIKKLVVSDIIKQRMKKFVSKCLHFCNTQCKLLGIEVNKSSHHILQSDIFINATPIGMDKKDASPINKKLLRKDMFVYDVIYNRQTQLIKDAKKVGAPFSDGLDMLIYQGMKSFELWTGKKPPIEIMRQVITTKIQSSHR
ncbi:MAG: shikimate dehydrogenase [Elusimicrobiota bacterium]